MIYSLRIVETVWRQNQTSNITDDGLIFTFGWFQIVHETNFRTLMNAQSSDIFVFVIINCATFEPIIISDSFFWICWFFEEILFLFFILRPFHALGLEILYNLLLFLLG